MIPCTLLIFNLSIDQTNTTFFTSVSKILELSNYSSIVQHNNFIYDLSSSGNKPNIIFKM